MCELYFPRFPHLLASSGFCLWRHEQEWAGWGGRQLFASGFCSVVVASRSCTGNGARMVTPLAKGAVSSRQSDSDRLSRWHRCWCSPLGSFQPGVFLAASHLSCSLLLFRFPLPALGWVISLFTCGFWLCCSLSPPSCQSKCWICFLNFIFGV